MQPARRRPGPYFLAWQAHTVRPLPPSRNRGVGNLFYFPGNVFQPGGRDPDKPSDERDRTTGRTLEEDRQQADWLYNSEKNRAENVMILDMVRNDMGRIARTGSVQVPELFKIEKYSTVWQMTSTVQAETEAGLCEIMQSLFPAASITGAPKIKTMQLINGLESSPCGIYTGAIGYFAPGRKAQFNVAIRTIHIDKLRQEAKYGVGGGIVWDSEEDMEWEETIDKARFFSSAPSLLSCWKRCVGRRKRAGSYWSSIWSV